MDHAYLALLAAAHKAEQLAGIFDYDGEEDAARARRVEAGECRHGMQILAKRYGDWKDALMAILKDDAGHQLVTEDYLRDLYRDDFTADEAADTILTEIRSQAEVPAEPS